MTIAFTDVHYRNNGARAACVVIGSWDDRSPSATFVRDIEAVEPYKPGSFYRRELPCLLAVLRLLPALPEVVVVDGYVWLSPGDRPGLGAHLHDALERKTTVIGIAKSAFAGVESCTNAIPVLRGASRRPLYVTAVGIEPVFASECVRRMAGRHRIPDIVMITDRLARGGVSWK